MNVWEYLWCIFCEGMCNRCILIREKIIGKGPIYLSGPMKSRPGYNYPLFNEIAKKWRDEGWRVINPAESFGGKPHHPRQKYLRLDFQYILKCRAVAMLPDWQESAGAVTEHLMAAGLEYPIYDAITMKPLHPDDCILAHHTVDEIIHRLDK